MFFQKKNNKLSTGHIAVGVRELGEENMGEKHWNSHYQFCQKVLPTYSTFLIIPNRVMLNTFCKSSSWSFPPPLIKKVEKRKDKKKQIFSNTFQLLFFPWPFKTLVIKQRLKKKALPVEIKRQLNNISIANDWNI